MRNVKKFLALFLVFGTLAQRRPVPPQCFCEGVEFCSASSARTTSQVIVSFRTYQNAEELEVNFRKLMGEAAANQPLVSFHWKVIPRNNPASGYPTDFLLVELTGTENQIQSVRRHLESRSGSIKYVTNQKHISRRRLAEVEEFEKPQRFKTKGRFFQEDEAEAAQRRRKLLGSEQVTSALAAKHLWDKGFSGQGVKVAVFDTGIADKPPHIKNVEERTNWTDEPTLIDGLGHGTFVAGVIASHKECLGFAPDAKIHTFRVFTNAQMSYTSWFLDAFNHAILTGMDVLNLSIGGPDFLDFPFVDKIDEMSANNIIVVSAIGNDGPFWGTLNSPADQVSAIGVGGITYQNTMAAFSSRGMSTWELPNGYGRFKPDVVAYGKDILGSSIGGGCRSLSGTSVASPVVAGCVALLASVVPKEKRKQLVNPASMKQVLVESATKLPTAGGIFEQGAGKINLKDALYLLKDYKPKASVVPNKLDLTESTYMWPFFRQALYASAMPTILNVTVLNPLSVSGTFAKPIRFLPDNAEDEGVLEVLFSHQDVIWPWATSLGIHITVRPQHAQTTRIVKGTVSITVASDKGETSSTDLPLTVSVIPTPPRDKRLLWDQFHNIRYPAGYFPRDDLQVGSDILDWTGDHIHTNYRGLYDHLKEEGYFVEVLGQDWTCFDASLYSTLLLVDAEEHYFPEEVEKLYHDVTDKGLSLFVAADWYNEKQIDEVKFFDDNTDSDWFAATGGANVPALNDALKPFRIALGDEVFEGTLSFRNGFNFASGNSIARFPQGGYLQSTTLQNVVTNSRSEQAYLGAINGAVSAGETNKRDKSGWVVVYGDSNCIDGHRRRGQDCYRFVSEILKICTDHKISRDLFDDPHLSEAFKSDSVSPPRPYTESGNHHIIRYSQVLSPEARPQCSSRGAQSSWSDLPDLAPLTGKEKNDLALPHAKSKKVKYGRGEPHAGRALLSEWLFEPTAKELSTFSPDMRALLAFLIPFNLCIFLIAVWHQRGTSKVRTMLPGKVQ